MTQLITIGGAMCKCPHSPTQYGTDRVKKVSTEPKDSSRFIFVFSFFSSLIHCLTKVLNTVDKLINPSL